MPDKLQLPRDLEYLLKRHSRPVEARRKVQRFISFINNFDITPAPADIPSTVELRAMIAYLEAYYRFSAMQYIIYTRGENLWIDNWDNFLEAIGHMLEMNLDEEVTLLIVLAWHILGDTFSIENLNGIPTEVKLTAGALISATQAERIVDIHNQTNACYLFMVPLGRQIVTVNLTRGIEVLKDLATRGAKSSEVLSVLVASVDEVEPRVREANLEGYIDYIVDPNPNKDPNLLAVLVYGLHSIFLTTSDQIPGFTPELRERLTRAMGAAQEC